MRRSLETEQTLKSDPPLLTAPRAGETELAARELRPPETQARQNASIATRNPNRIVPLPPTSQQLAIQAQVAAAIARREQQQRRYRLLDHVTNGEPTPTQRQGEIFETFAIALASGMAMGDALRQAVRTVPVPLQTLFANIAAEIERGATLTQALKTHQEQLPDVVVPIFEHGLIYGTMENAARQTARALKHLGSVEARFEYTALNPGFWMPLVTGGSLILSLLPFFLICANPLVPYTLFCTLLLGGSALGWKFRYRWMQRRSTHARVSNLALRGIGQGFVRRQMGGARWSRTFAALWHCGVPIGSALEAAGRSTRSAHYERILRDAAQATRRGVGLGDSLAHVGLLKGEMLNVVRTGETTGDLGPALEQWADVLEDDARQRGGQILFLYTFGLLFAGALLVCILALIFALVYSGRPLPID